MPARAATTGSAATSRRTGRTVREVAFLAACALAFSLGMKTLVVQVFEVPSASMEPTLLIGDKIAVGRFWPHPLSLERGDVVVFQDPAGWLDAPARNRSAALSALEFVGLVPRNNGSHLVKRIIGKGGDTVQCLSTGKLLVNGTAPDQPYLRAADRNCGLLFNTVVPANCLWVMGDNRSNSADSRYHQDDANGGCVPEIYVVGKVVGVIWPLSSAGPV